MTAPDRLEATQSDAEGILFCSAHPTVATNLRCNRCGRPMCTRCAVKTPVGYRCRECVRSQQDKFFDAQLRDYLIAGVVSLTISFFAAGLLARLGWFLIAFFLSPAAGALIGRAVWRLTGRRRGRYTAIVVGANVVVGALPFFLLNPLTIGIYLVMATGTAVAQFRPRL